MEANQYLKSNPLFSVICISEFHPLNKTQIETYREAINWNEIAINKEIKWSAELIKGFSSEIRKAIKGNMQWDDDCIEACENPTFPWSEELIEQFKNDFDWSYLAQNLVFLSHKDLVNKYSSYLTDYEDLLSRPFSVFRGEDNFGFFDETNPSFIFKKEFQKLYNSEIFWSRNTINQYKEQLDWYWLSRYRKLTWDNDLISAFKDKWDIGGLLLNPSVKIDIDTLLILDPPNSVLLSPTIRERVWKDIFAIKVNDNDITEILGFFASDYTNKN